MQICSGGVRSRSARCSGALVPRGSQRCWRHAADRAVGSRLAALCRRHARRSPPRGRLRERPARVASQEMPYDER